MPTGYQWWISEDQYSYRGPYPTKEEAIKQALQNEVFHEVNDNEIGFHICEAQTPVMEDIIIDADALLVDLADAYEEYQNEDGQVFTNLESGDIDDLQDVLNQAFQTWARDHDIKLPNTCIEMRNEEFLTMPKPKEN